jgi:hypothetical protein
VDTWEEDEIKPWHERIQEGEGEDFRFFTSLDFVQPCGDAKEPSGWQSGLLFEQREGAPMPQDLPDELFFTIVKRDGVFYLQGIANPRGYLGGKPPPGT